MSQSPFIWIAEEPLFTNFRCTAFAGVKGDVPVHCTPLIADGIFSKGELFFREEYGIIEGAGAGDG